MVYTTFYLLVIKIQLLKSYLFSFSYEEHVQLLPVLKYLLSVFRVSKSNLLSLSCNEICLNMTSSYIFSLDSRTPIDNGSNYFTLNQSCILVLDLNQKSITDDLKESEYNKQTNKRITCNSGIMLWFSTSKQFKKQVLRRLCICFVFKLFQFSCLVTGTVYCHIGKLAEVTRVAIWYVW